MTAPNVFGDFKFGRFEQAAFGTGAVAADAVTLLEIEKNVLPIPDNITVSESASASRYKDELNITGDVKMVAPEFSIPGMIDTKELAHQLYSWFQNVANTTGDLTFTIASTQPDFPADAGYFASYIFRCVEYLCTI